MGQYELEKWIWDESDFNQMGWHDCTIYAISFEDNILIDLDYILRWVNPSTKGGSFNFWISPATLIFKNPTKFKLEIDLDFINGIEIMDIYKNLVNKKTNYTIETQEGIIYIESEKYQQIIRRPPSFQTHLSLSKLERGENCFSLQSDKGFQPSKTVLEIRELNYKIDELNNQNILLENQKNSIEKNESNSKNKIIEIRKINSDILTNNNKIEIIENKILKKYG